MIPMKCPQCGRTAEVLESMTDDGHRCHYCNFELDIADPLVAAHRNQANTREQRGTVLGACVGAMLVFLIGAVGGEVGLALAAGLAGTLLGVVVGLVAGLIDGVGMSAMMADGSWLSEYALFTAIAGGVVGFIAGVSGAAVDEVGKLVILLWGSIGGFFLGALIGARLGRVWAGPAPSANDRPAN